jgi:hypothetical protein
MQTFEERPTLTSLKAYSHRTLKCCDVTTFTVPYSSLSSIPQQRDANFWGGADTSIINSILTQDTKML